MEQRYKVILADDDADDRDLFVELLSKPTVDVQTFFNGTELLSYLETLQSALPDCIFLDLNMPVVGGKVCLQRIRSTERLKHIPIIIYSTSANRKDIEDTFYMGANLYIVKSSSYVAMRNILEHVVALNWDNFRPNKSLVDFLFKLP